MIRSVLVVCEGNVCRSPMAAAILGHLAANAVRIVSSAGIAALDGHGADPRAIALMRKRGIDLTVHTARTIHGQLVRSHELVFAMTRFQRDWLLTRYPFSRGRVYPLLQTDEGECIDILDPFRLDDAAFSASLAQIETGVADWIHRLGIAARAGGPSSAGRSS